MFAVVYKSEHNTPVIYQTLAEGKSDVEPYG